MRSDDDHPVLFQFSPDTTLKQKKQFFIAKDSAEILKGCYQGKLCRVLDDDYPGTTKERMDAITRGRNAIGEEDYAVDSQVCEDLVNNILIGESYSEQRESNPLLSCLIQLINKITGRNIANRKMLATFSQIVLQKLVLILQFVLSKGVLPACGDDIISHLMAFCRSAEAFCSSILGGRTMADIFWSLFSELPQFWYENWTQISKLTNPHTGGGTSSPQVISKDIVARYSGMACGLAGLTVGSVIGTVISITPGLSALISLIGALTGHVIGHYQCTGDGTTITNKLEAWLADELLCIQKNPRHYDFNYATYITGYVILASIGAAFEQVKESFMSFIYFIARFLNLSTQALRKLKEVIQRLFGLNDIQA